MLSQLRSLTYQQALELICRSRFGEETIHKAALRLIEEAKQA